MVNNLGFKISYDNLKMKVHRNSKVITYWFKKKKKKGKNKQLVLIVIEATYSLHQKLILMVVKKTRNKECSQKQQKW